MFEQSSDNVAGSGQDTGAQLMSPLLQPLVTLTPVTATLSETKIFDEWGSDGEDDIDHITVAGTFNESCTNININSM